MTCIRFSGGIICISPFYRLRLADGTCVFMEWHQYCGPTFFRDRACRRLIEDWWDMPLICAACSWFTGRGERA